MTARLAGIRVVAIEQAVAAPLCSRHLADLGADVVKIERTDRGDFARDYDAFVAGESSHFVWLNRGKRSVALDLKSPAGRAVLLALLRDADVLLSNLAPGAVERIVPDAELVELNPRLVRCRISGYGPDGPYAERKAFDLLVQGEAGVTASTGTPGNPAKPGVSLADLGAGIYAATAILAALLERDRTGLGSLVDIAMFDVMVEWMSPLLLAYREAGVEIEPAGTRHATITPYGSFAARDGGALNIAVQNDRQWLALCRVLGLDALAGDEALATNAGRFRQRDRVERAVGEAVRTRDADALAAELDRAGIPWGRLNGIAEVARHEQLAARRRWEPVELPSGGTASVLASPFERTGSAGAPRRVPALGADTAAVLREAGFSGEEVADLAAAGVVRDGAAVLR